MEKYFCFCYDEAMTFILKLFSTFKTKCWRKKKLFPFNFGTLFQTKTHEYFTFFLVKNEHKMDSTMPATFFPWKYFSKMFVQKVNFVFSVFDNQNFLIILIFPTVNCNQTRMDPEIWMLETETDIHFLQ